MIIKSILVSPKGGYLLYGFNSRKPFASLSLIITLKPGWHNRNAWIRSVGSLLPRNFGSHCCYSGSCDFPDFGILWLMGVPRYSFNKKHVVKKSVDSTPFKNDEEVPKPLRQSMRERQRAWTLAGLHHIKAPIATCLQENNSKASQSF